MRRMVKRAKEARWPVAMRVLFRPTHAHARTRRLAAGTQHPCPGPARSQPAHARWRPEGAGPSPPRRRKPCGGAMAALARAAVSVRPERAAVRPGLPRAAGPAPRAVSGAASQQRTCVRHSPARGAAGGAAPDASSCPPAHGPLAMAPSASPRPRGPCPAVPPLGERRFLHSLSLHKI